MFFFNRFIHSLSVRSLLGKLFIALTWVYLFCSAQRVKSYLETLLQLALRLELRVIEPIQGLNFRLGIQKLQIWPVEAIKEIWGLKPFSLKTWNLRANKFYLNIFAHGLQTPNESFFSNIPNSMWGILRYFW